METQAATAVPPADTSTRADTARIAILIALGALAGGAILFDGQLTVETPAIPLGIATLCYLASGVTDLRWMAWAWLGAGSALIVGAELTGTSWWTWLAAAGVVLLGVGAVRRARATLPQAIGMVAYLGVAVTALQLEPRLGLTLAAIGLAAHAGWDIVHYRRDIVVHRSLALLCIGLDLTVGLACLAAALPR